MMIVGQPLNGLRRTLADVCRRIVGMVLLACFCVACTTLPGLYRVDIEEGNRFTQSQVDQLELGMSQQQVLFILGSPILTTPFVPNRWDYLYVRTNADGSNLRKLLTLFFKDGVLSEVRKDFVEEQTPDEDAPSEQQSS